MGVPAPVSSSCLFKLTEKLEFRVEAQAFLNPCCAARTCGLGLEAEPEPVLEGGIDLDRWHSSLLVGTAKEAFGILRVNLPEATLSWLIFLPWHFDEALVE